VRTLTIVAVYSRRIFLNWLTSWSWTLTLLANQAIAPLIGMAIWTNATDGRADVVTYYAALLVVGRFTTGYSAYTFSGAIYNGELTDAILRPHPVFLGQLGWYFGVAAFDVLFVAPIVVVLAITTSAHVTLSDAALAIPATLLAATTAFSFDFALACSAFWTQRYFAATEAGGRLLFLFGGVAAPIPLLPGGARSVFEALPFRFMRGFPAELAAGLVPRHDVASSFGAQTAWALGFAALAAVTFRIGIRRYTAVGG
jgi:ABC-2 type transport system permease protein